ncbi:hypothetical protein H2248_002424 [Termitomyces sp. 'cryptogamus']|nr:hypothetical protein H2248_002424 [Termitomyces sp. 'cryptogamus']
MSAPKKDMSTPTSGSIVRKGLLTPQSSFSKAQGSASTSLKRKIPFTNFDSDEVSARSDKKTRLAEITAALQGSSRSELEGLQTRTLNSYGHLPRTSPSTHLVWVDLETTDATIAYQDMKILEIAVRITDKDLTPLDDGVSFLVHWPGKDIFAALNLIPVVAEMHRKSRLEHDYNNTPVSDRKSLAQVEGLVCNYVKGHGIQSYAIMAGAGIGYDRNMIRHHMPEFDKLFHHQIFDTTSLWHIISRIYGRQQRFKGSVLHRAMDDVNGAIHEAKFYRDLVFKAPAQVNWPSMDGI